MFVLVLNMSKVTCSWYCLSSKRAANLPFGMSPLTSTDQDSGSIAVAANQGLAVVLKILEPKEFTRNPRQATVDRHTPAAHALLSVS